MQNIDIEKLQAALPHPLTAELIDDVVRVTLPKCITNLATVEGCAGCGVEEALAAAAVNNIADILQHGLDNNGKGSE
jgi:hypothetical protein